MCYISSIFLYFHWDFDSRHYFYDKWNFIGFFKSSSSGRLYLQVLVTIPRTWKQRALTVSYVTFLFVSSIALFSSRKKWLDYLSHVISPYLHEKLINWISAIYLSFSCTVLPRILNTLIFLNRVISIIFVCQLYFMLFDMLFYIAWYLYQFWQPVDILFN